MGLRIPEFGTPEELADHAQAEFEYKFEEYISVEALIRFPDGQVHQVRGYTFYRPDVEAYNRLVRGDDLDDFVILSLAAGFRSIFPTIVIPGKCNGGYDEPQFSGVRMYIERVAPQALQSRPPLVPYQEG